MRTFPFEKQQELVYPSHREGSRIANENQNYV